MTENCLLLAFLLKKNKKLFMVLLNMVIDIVVSYWFYKASELIDYSSVDKKFSFHYSYVFLALLLFQFLQVCIFEKIYL